MPEEAAGVGESVEVRIERPVTGGAGLAREPSGRVVLVDGALPDELVTARITRSKRRMANAELLSVLESSPQRVLPPCPEVAAGCGGCNLQHAAPELQRGMKVEIVRDALAHLGRLPDVPVAAGEYLPSDGFRTVVRCGVVDGRAAFRRRRSSELHHVDACMVAHPLISEILETGRFPGADEVTIRVGARTGERMVLVAPTAYDVTVPDDVLVVGADTLDEPSAHRRWIHEVVARRRFRISAGSFFQARPGGAEALARAVTRALAPFDPNEHRLVDLYGGVGLFTKVLGARRAVLVESSDSAAADAEVNLGDLGATVVQSKVGAWEPVPADAVVADPPRAGLGEDGIRAIVGTGAARIALVSCDPASLARDVRDLVEHGHEILGVELVDMFPHTHHVEAVATLRRRGVT